jgi:RNA polymerase sigma factor (sigma-70 family)
MRYKRVSCTNPTQQSDADQPLLTALTAYKPLLARNVRWAREAGLLRYHHQHKDAWQAARLGFIQAYRRYDPSRGASIGGFARPHVTGAVREALAAYAVEGTAVSIEDVAEAGDDALQVEDAASRTEALETTAMVRAFVAGLTPRQQYVVDQVFWHDRSQADIARELGITRQAVAMTLESVYARGRRAFAWYPAA